MALERQIVTIPLAQGLDTKTDPKQTAPGRMTLLQNAVFTTGKKLRKRYGTSTKSQSIFGGGSISSADTLRAFRGELTLGSSGSLYSWSSATSTWKLKGSKTSVDVSRRPLPRSTYTTIGASSACIGNMLCTVWADSGSLSASISSVQLPDSAITVTVESALAPESVHVAVLNNQFVVGFNAAGTLYYRTLSVAGVVGSRTTVATAYGTYDFGLVGNGAGNSVFWAYVQGGEIYTRTLNSSMTLSAATALGVGATSVTAISVGMDTNNGNLLIVYQFYAAVTWSIRFAAVTPALAVSAVNVVVETGIPGSNVEPLCIGTVASGAIRCWYTLSAGASVSDPRIVRTCVLTGYTAGSPSTLLRNVMVCSTPAIYSGADYLVVHSGDQVNRGYFLINAITGVVVSRVALADGTIARQLYVTEMVCYGSTIVCPIFLSMLRGATEATEQQTPALSLFTFRTTPDQSVDIGNTCVRSAGVCGIYDGDTLTEQGFNQAPELITPSVAAGGTIPVGLVGVACTFEWTDFSGAVHRSSPVFGSVSTTGGNQTISVIVPTLRVTGKNNVKLVLYRTVANGSIYYRDTDDRNGPNDTFTFTRYDEVLTSNPTLYTTGGVLDNQPAPLFSSMVVYRNRVVGINAENPTQLWYSKQVIPGEPVEFSDFLVLNLDPVGGDATALAALDDKLIIFKGGVAYYITGSGPDSTGAQNDFSVPILINTNSGCSEPRSVITAANGVMYQSAKGYYILDRSLQDSYIGAAVEAFNTLPVRSVIQTPGTNEVRFTVSGGNTLVYDFLYEQWSVFTGPSAIDSTVWSGVVHTVSTSGVVSYENQSVFTDNGTAIELRLTTGWLSGGDLQSFLRIYKLMLLGEWKSSHTLNVWVQYDYRSDTATENKFAIVASSNPYPAQFQYRINLAQQKCESIRLTIFDSSISGESLDLSAISFEVGGKAGPMRLPASGNV
jgi:hypothetical protein